MSKSKKETLYWHCECGNNEPAQPGYKHGDWEPCCLCEKGTARVVTLKEAAAWEQAKALGRTWRPWMELGMAEPETMVLQWGTKVMEFHSDGGQHWLWTSEDRLIEIYIWNSVTGWRGDLSVTDKFCDELGDDRICVVSGDSPQHVLRRIYRSWLLLTKEMRQWR